MRYVLSAALAGVALAAAAVPASAAIVVDVDNYQVFSPAAGAGAASYVSPSPGNVVAYQTWTAEQSGRLVAIELFGALEGVNGAYYLDVFEGGDPLVAGAFSDDRIIAHVALSFATPRPPGLAYPMLFQFSRPIYAEAGDRFTFRMRVDGCTTATCRRQFITFHDGVGGLTTGGYSGGALYTSVNRARPVELPTDANFRTYVAVPEPATWAMMVLGFFAGGRLVRRLREASRPA